MSRASTTNPNTNASASSLVANARSAPSFQPPTTTGQGSSGSPVNPSTPTFNYAQAAAKSRSSAASSNAGSVSNSPHLGPSNPQPAAAAARPDSVPSLPNGKAPGNLQNGNARNGNGGGSGAYGSGTAPKRVPIKDGVSAPRPVGMKDGSINFGTIDDSQAVLSSSPAAPSLAGKHLDGHQPRFGSIDLGSGDNLPSLANAKPSTKPEAPAGSKAASDVKSSATTAPTSSAARPPAFDLNSFFMAAPQPSSPTTPTFSPPPQEQRRSASTYDPSSSRPTSAIGPSVPSSGSHMSHPHPHHQSHLSGSSRPFSPHPIPQQPPSMNVGIGAGNSYMNPSASPYQQPQQLPHSPHFSGHPSLPPQPQQPQSGPNYQQHQGPPHSPYQNSFHGHAKSPSSSLSGPPIHMGGSAGSGPNGIQGHSGPGLRPGPAGGPSFHPMQPGRPPLSQQHSSSHSASGSGSKYGPTSPRLPNAASPLPTAPAAYQPYGYPYYYQQGYGSGGPFPAMPPHSSQHVPPQPASGAVPSSGTSTPAPQHTRPPTAPTPVPPSPAPSMTSSVSNSGWTNPYSNAQSSSNAPSTGTPSTPTTLSFRQPSSFGSSFSASAAEFKPGGPSGAPGSSFVPAKRQSAAIPIRRPPANAAAEIKKPEKLDVKPDAKPDVKPEVKSEVKAEVKEVPKVEAKPAVKEVEKPAEPAPTEEKAISKESAEPTRKEEPAAKAVEVTPDVPSSKADEKPKPIEEAVQQASAEVKDQPAQAPEPTPAAPKEEKPAEVGKKVEAKEEAAATEPKQTEKVTAAAEEKVAEKEKKVAEKEEEVAEKEESKDEQQKPLVESDKKVEAPAAETSTPDVKAPEAATTEATKKPVEDETSKPSETPATSAPPKEENPSVEAKDLPKAPESTPSTDAPKAPLSTVKPVNGFASSQEEAGERKKRPVPGPLDLSNTGSAGGNVASPGPKSALLSARIIDDLSRVTYPSNIQSPRPDLNSDAAPGKYRYDRSFLLQFMPVCTERPENLGSLEAIGMTDESNAAGPGGLSRPGSLSGHRRPSSGVGPSAPSRAASSSGPMGLPGHQVPRMASGSGFPMMGSMGAFKPMTSDDRYAAARAPGPGTGGFGALPGRPGAMSRTPSASQMLPGMMGVRDGGRRSQRGSSRRQAQESRGPPSLTGLDGQPVAPLQESENRWVPQRAASLATDPLSPEVVNRKVKALLNKITLENFDSISNQILDWANKSENETDARILRQVIAVIFEKATDEATWSELYARLCRKILEQLSQNVKVAVKDDKGEEKVLAGGSVFRKFLLTRCQEDYEAGWKQRDEAVAAAADKAMDDKAKRDANERNEADGGPASKEAEMLSDEYYAAQKAKRRGLGLVTFIGELTKLAMLTPSIMHTCFMKLLGNVNDPEEEDIESLCRLMRTVGEILDRPDPSTPGHKSKSQQKMDIYFARMNQMSESPNIDSRMRFMLQDIRDLRAAHWKARNAPSGPKLISQIHEDAAREKEQAAEEARRSQSSGGKGLPKLADQLARGGSRRGQHRDGGFGVPPPGSDGWSTVGNAPPPRPTKAGDLSSFGKIRETGGALKLGPSGIFGSKKAVKDDKAAPGQNVTAANRFGPLSQMEPSAADQRPSDPSASTPEATERPRLNLQPRTIPVASEPEAAAAAAATTPAAAPSSDEPTAAATEVPASVKNSIKNSVEEFFAIKDVSEGVACFGALEAKYRAHLVEAFVRKAIDKKKDDVAALSSLFTASADKGELDAGMFKDGFKPVVVTADDDSVDSPGIYTHLAMMLAGAKLAESDVKDLSEVMESEEDVDAAKEKLLAAFKKEAA